MKTKFEYPSTAAIRYSHAKQISLMRKHETKHFNCLTEEDLEQIYDEMELPENHEQRYHNEFIPRPFYKELPD